jgi:putative salt-induced outer membrane protein YdiY
MHSIRRRLTPFIALVAACPAVLRAQDKPKPREFSTDVGFVNTAGNTDVTTLSVGEKLVLRGGNWEHKQQIGFVYGKQNDKQTSNLLLASWRSDFALSKSIALFGLAGFDRNTFAGISRRFEEALGVAAKLVNRPAERWGMEVGVGLNQKYATDGTHSSYSSLRAGTSFRHEFSKTSYAFQTVEYLPSLKVSADYRINSETGLVAPVSGHASLKVGYVVRFSNLPEPGHVKSDRIFTTGLQFNW